MNTFPVAESIHNFMAAPSTIYLISCSKEMVAAVEGAGLNIPDYPRLLHASLVKLYEAGCFYKEIALHYSTEAEDLLPVTPTCINRSTGLLHRLSKDHSANKNIFEKSFGDYQKQIHLNGAEVIKLAALIHSIYKDVKAQIAKIEGATSNAVLEDGLWQIKTGFYLGWGKNCTAAINLLHAYCF